MGDCQMKKIIKSIIKTIKEVSAQEDFKLRHRSKQTDFIRERKLSFSSVIMFVLGLSNTSFDFERINFCNAANIARYVAPSKVTLNNTFEICCAVASPGLIPGI